MGFLTWIRSHWPERRKRARAVVTFDDDGVSCRWPDGSTDSIAWSHVQSIEIQTTDGGPFVEDVFFVLRSTDGVCVIPQEAEGSSLLLEHLQKWPGFDHQAVISAMCCTDNATFRCWQRTES